MSFRLATMDVGQTPPIEYREVTANETVVLGEALVTASGKLTKCGATAKPEYIAVGPSEGGVAPVIKVQDYMTFEAPLSAAGTSLAIGNSVTLHTDGLQVTATTASGVAKIVRMDGTAVGDMVHVRF
ncbi:MAG: hypothetical protein MJ074_06705 [Oscillospiraceae bacterium]|nr:hypothetical protein [Oscillospiraceae bacterium]